MIGVKFEPRDVVRIGIVGVGLRGTEVLGEFLAIDKVVINAVCDVVKDKCQRAAQMVEKAGQKTLKSTPMAKLHLRSCQSVTIWISSISRPLGNGTYLKFSPL